MTPYAQQVFICAGLRDMREEDFKYDCFDPVPVENAMGLKWAYKVLSDVWCCPQFTGRYAMYIRNGAGPLLDFYLDVRLNMCIELAVIRNFEGKRGTRDRLERFVKNYARFVETCAVSF